MIYDLLLSQKHTCNTRQSATANKASDNLRQQSARHGAACRIAICRCAHCATQQRPRKLSTAYATNDTRDYFRQQCHTDRFDKAADNAASNRTGYGLYY
jgi:hypothetical protein